MKLSCLAIKMKILKILKIDHICLLRSVKRDFWNFKSTRWYQDRRRRKNRRRLSKAKRVRTKLATCLFRAKIRRGARRSPFSKLFRKLRLRVTLLSRGRRKRSQNQRRTWTQQTAAARATLSSWSRTTWATTGITKAESAPERFIRTALTGYPTTGKPQKPLSAQKAIQSSILATEYKTQNQLLTTGSGRARVPPPSRPCRSTRTTPTNSKSGKKARTRPGNLTNRTRAATRADSGKLQNRKVAPLLLWPHKTKHGRN